MGELLYRGTVGPFSIVQPEVPEEPTGDPYKLLKFTELFQNPGKVEKGKIFDAGFLNIYNPNATDLVIVEEIYLCRSFFDDGTPNGIFKLMPAITTSVKAKSTKGIAFAAKIPNNAPEGDWFAVIEIRKPEEV